MSPLFHRSARPAFRPLPTLRRLLCAATCLASAAQATSPASIYCPAGEFLSGNVAVNPGLETPHPLVPLGQTTCWTPTSGGIHAAAEGWTMHSSNSGAQVCSTLLASNAPGNQGGRMLRFKAGSNEGGITQPVPGAAGKTYMFSAWVKVSRGRVALQPNGGGAGPVSWSSKIGEWEQLRVCTDATGVTDSLVIYNQAAEGGLFFVDRVELRETTPGN